MVVGLHFSAHEQNIIDHKPALIPSLWQYQLESFSVHQLVDVHA